MSPAKTPLPGENTQQTLAYWMGRVDAALAELRGAVEKVVNNEDANWRDFRIWRQGVDDRLSKGSQNFEEIDRRLKDLEEARCPMGQNCPAIDKINLEKKAESEKPAFGTWAWFRDNYLDKAVFALFMAALFIIAQIIVQAWIIKSPGP